MNSFLWMLAGAGSGPAAGLLLAYVDPGAGSLLLQLLLGGLAGATVIAKIYWKRLRGWFGRSDSPAHDARPHQQE